MFVNDLLMVKGVRLIYNTSYVFIEVRPDTTFLNCIQQFIAVMCLKRLSYCRNNQYQKKN